MATPKETLIKFMMLSDILKAASLLHELKLIEEEPAAIVKKYVLANPDINRDLNNEKSELHAKLNEELNKENMSWQQSKLMK